MANERLNPARGEGGPRHSNPNLLHNWYFGNPVNRNGLKEYAGGSNVYTIDGWILDNVNQTLSIVDGGVLINSGTDGAFEQFLDTYGYEKLAGRAMTVTAISEQGELLTATGTVPGEKPSTNTLIASNLLANKYRVQLRWNNRFVFVLQTLAGSNIKFVAAKLELGDTQTLAQLENGVWVLNEIPDYAEQYAICEQYSPITGEFVGSQHCNRNLLDNWYFVGGGSQQGGGQFPINQRGQTEYLTNTYTFDRWFNGRVQTKIQDDGIKFSLQSNKANGYLAQRLEVDSAPAGKTVTFSALGDNTLYILTGVFPKKGDPQITTGYGKYGNIQLALGNLANENFPIVQIWLNNNDEHKLQAVKLEEGSVQTLAHKEGDTWVLNEVPDYGQELAKCQRYQYLVKSGVISPARTFGSDATKAVVFIQTPVPMRANPTISVGGNDSVSCWSTKQIKGTISKSGTVTGSGVSAQITLSDTSIGTAHNAVMDIADDMLLDANL